MSSIKQLPNFATVEDVVEELKPGTTLTNRTVAATRRCTRGRMISLVCWLRIGSEAGEYIEVGQFGRRRLKPHFRRPAHVAVTLSS